MKANRNIKTVLNSIISEIPNDRVLLKIELEKIKEDALIKAPEDNIPWNKTHAILFKNFPEPKEEWHFKLWALFTDNTVENIKKSYLLSLNQ